MSNLDERRKEIQTKMQLNYELGICFEDYYSEKSTLVTKQQLLSKMKNLLKQGASLELMNGNNETLLAQAIYKNDLEMAKILIDLGANVNAKKVMFALAKRGDEQFIDYMIERGTKNFTDGLTGAIVCNNYEMIDFFIDLGANINDNEVIEMAVRSERIELIRYLVSKGAKIDIYKSIRYGESLLELASKDIAEYLIAEFGDDEDENE